MMRHFLRGCVFASLLGAFLYFESFLQPGHEFRVVRLAEGKAVGFFVIGAALAVWGNKQSAGFDPMPLRGVFIVLGAVLMAFAVILAYALRQPTA